MALAAAAGERRREGPSRVSPRPSDPVCSHTGAMAVTQAQYNARRKVLRDTSPRSLFVRTPWFPGDLWATDRVATVARLENKRQKKRERKRVCV